MASSDFRRRVERFGLSTAQIFRRPGHPTALQSCLWRGCGRRPHFPALRKFLDFWTRELDGEPHSVVVAHARLVEPSEFRRAHGEFPPH